MNNILLPSQVGLINKYRAAFFLTPPKVTEQCSVEVSLTEVTYLTFIRVELTFRIFIGIAEPVPKNITSG